MLQIYFKLALRNLLANKLVTGINIFGLSIAVGCSIVVFLFLRNHWTMDNFHRNGDRIFIAEYTVDNQGQAETWGDSPIPLGPALAADFPQVERAVRVELQGAKVYLDNRVFDEVVYFADTGFFDVFTFPLQTGTPVALTEPDAVILSADAAKKFFNGADAVGKEVTLVFENQVRKVFTVKGVAAPFPENTGFRFSLITGFNALTATGTDGLTDWGRHIWGTFVQLHRPDDIGVLSTKMNRYTALHNAANREVQMKALVFDNLRHPNPRAYDVMRRPAEAAHPIVTVIFSLIALLMMALSCFNYINISLGYVGKRLKEIGIRKTIGGRKMQVVGQFMSENLLLCFLALLIGLVLAQTVFTPFFNAIMVTQVSVSFGANPWLWAFLVGLLLFTALASGAYPAFYVSAFRPVAILKGRQQLDGKKGLTRVLLVTQFMLAFATVIIGVVIAASGRYWKNLPWGYQPDQTLVLRLEHAGQFSFLKNEASRNPHVLQVAGSADHVGEMKTNELVFVGNDTLEAIRYDVGAGYFEAMGLRLKTGRFFDERRPREDADAVLVNATFLKKRSWTDAVGREIRLNDQTCRVVGVVDDFKSSASRTDRPVVFHLAEPDHFGYLVLRHAAGAGGAVQGYMKTAWERLYPETPFNYFRQEKVFDSFYQGYNNLSLAFGYIAALALIIACLGLFGLAAQNFSSRLKEVSIRKVLGASTPGIILLANRQFLSMLALAGILATGACYAGIQLVMNAAEEFTGGIRLGVAPYLIANLIVFLTAALAVGGQSWKLARTAPVDTLRNE